MQQRGACQPGHEGGIFDRVPEPEAAPAKLVIGPVGAHRDAACQEYPGGQHPGAHPARPRGVDPSFDQSRDSEREADRKPDIAQIKQRRVHRETDVLQHRVEVASFDRRGVQPCERVGRHQNEKQECRADPTLHTKHIGTQRCGQIGTEQSNHRAEQHQYQHPQKHRAFVVPPRAGHFVEKRLQRMGVFPDIRDGKVGRDIGRDERTE